MLLGTKLTPAAVADMSDDPTAPLSGTALRKRISKIAQDRGDDLEKQGVEEANGMKEEWGTGVSSLIVIKNMLDVPITFQNDKDYNGHIWKYTYDDEIHPGQCSVVLHVKTSRVASGSCATIGYNIPGYDAPYTWWMTWYSVWSGTNSVYSRPLKTNPWNETPWADVARHSEAEGKERYKRKTGVITSKGKTSQASSPLVIFNIYRNDAE